MRLFPIQSAALADIAACNGLVGAITVGGGKALISLLAPVALRARRPLLIVPAELKTQTIEHVIPAMREHWILHPYLEVVSYEWISTVRGADFLEKYAPDVIICDESHRLKSKKSARTRRFFRYFESHPDTKLVLLSGTITKNSLLDYYHLSALALGIGSPVPRYYREAEAWDLAISPKRDNGYYETVSPGPLGDSPREWLRDRLATCPGFVVSVGIDCPASIYIERLMWDFPEINRALKHLLDTWEGPDGWEYWDQLSLYQAAHQIAQGFYYRLTEEPPAEWLEARREYVRAVRTYLRYHKNIDSERQYRDSVESPEKTRWLAVRGAFEPKTETHWYSRALLQAIAHFGRRVAPTIIWTSHRATGQALAEMGMPFYDAGDSSILDERGARSIVASMRSHGTGKNLQAFNRNVILDCPASGETWEQLIGRTHRAGQQSDEIWCHVLQHHEILTTAWERAREEAAYQQETLGKRRLLQATVIKTERGK